MNPIAFPPVLHSSAAIGPAAGPSDSKVDKNMRAGTGLASSLLPREISTDEDFGEFAPQDILKGQNFLEPRAQIGFPGNCRRCAQKR